MKDKKLLFSSATTMLAILISLLLAFIIIFMISSEPLTAIRLLLTGPLQSKRLLGSIITIAIPICFTGLAVSVMFQADMFNMCAEGAFFLGALMGAFTATRLSLPGVLGLIVPMLVGALTGAVLTMIPAILKAKLNASEMVSSLMLNYVALYLGLFLLNNYLRDHSFGALATEALPANSKFAKMIPGTSIHAGFLVLVLFIVLSYLLIFKTKLGEKIRIYGQNASFARYSGIGVGSVIIASQAIGGAIAGLGGSIEIMGMYQRFQWTALPGYGWDGIVLAILARNKPQFVPVAALFLSYLRVGASAMASGSDVPKEIITVIQSIMIMLVTSSVLLRGLKQRMIVKEALKHGLDS